MANLCAYIAWFGEIMPLSFFSSAVRYHEKPVISEICFPESFQAVLTASKAYDELYRMECRFENKRIKNRLSPQRAKVDEVQTALAHACQQAPVSGLGLKEGELNLEVCNHRPAMFTIYLLAQEFIWTRDFRYVTTDKLNQLKQALITSLLQFKWSVLNNKKNEFYRYLESAGMLDSCREVIAQTQQLIAAAQSVSGVIASIVTGADVLAQIGLLDNNSVTDVFNIQLPGILSTEIQNMDLENGLNPAGSAFQFELARQSLINKLEMYLKKRAALDSQFEADGAVSRQYKSIDRGIFYNGELQQARIVIAANLLTQLQYGHLEDGTCLSNPCMLAKLLMNAIDANDQCYKQHARCIDGAGELAEYLDCMRKEMGEIYTQTISIEEDGTLITLHEQLRLEQTDSPLHRTKI